MVEHVAPEYTAFDSLQCPERPVGERVVNQIESELIE